MSVLPGYTDFNITNHNHKMINADHNFENYLLAHSSQHDYKSSRMQPTVKKVKASKILKTSKSAVPNHLVSTSSTKNRTKTHHQNSSFQHHNTNQNINSSSSSNHVTVNRSTAARTHSAHTDSKSANAQRTKTSNETNTYEKSTHPHTHSHKDRDRDRDRDTHTATNKDRDRIHVRGPGTGIQIPSLTRYDEQVRHSLLTLGLDPGPYTESYSPPVSARAHPGVHAVVRESPQRPRSAPPSASRPPTSTSASPSPPASPHVNVHTQYLHKTLRSASAEARRPSTLDSRGGIATLGKNERTRREPPAVRNIPKNVLPDRNGSPSARKDSHATLDLYPFSSPGRGRSGRPPVAPHPSLSAFHTSPHHSPQHTSHHSSQHTSHHSSTMPYSTARVMGVRAPSFSSTHMSSTPSSPSSHSYSRI
jgi:hypothetical protein